MVDARERIADLSVEHGGIMSPSAGYHARRVVFAVLTLAVVLLTTALPSSASGTPATAGRGSASFWHPLSEKPATAGRKVDIKAMGYRAFSLDRGAMWTTVNPGGGWVLQFDPANPKMIYTATEDGVYRLALP